MHPHGALTVSAEAAEHLGVTELPQHVRTNKPGNMPFVDVQLVTGTVEPHKDGFGLAVRSGADHSVKVGKGALANQDAKVVVAVDSLDGGNPHKVVDSLGAALSERLHGKRLERVARVGAIAVLATAMIAGNTILPGAGILAAGATYLGTRILGRFIPQKWSGSVGPSYAHAEKVMHGVVHTVAPSGRYH